MGERLVEGDGLRCLEVVKITSEVEDGMAVATSGAVIATCGAWQVLEMIDYNLWHSVC
jgi:hypothetical protein